jgi:hypothetical protein
MAPRTPAPGKKYFTAAQANAMLPLVRRIVQDITQLAHRLRGTQEIMARLAPESEEMIAAEGEFEHGREQMTELVTELRSLGIELKDFFLGLVDFPCLMDGREVYLCWRQGEPEIAFWHEVDAGFAGRQKLLVESQQ